MPKGILTKTNFNSILCPRLSMHNECAVVLNRGSISALSGARKIHQKANLGFSLLLSALLGTACLTASAGTTDTFKGSIST